MFLSVGMPFTTVGDFYVSWSPLTNLIGFGMSLKTSGKEDFYRRYCKEMTLGKCCCPISKYVLDLFHEPTSNFISNNFPLHTDTTFFCRSPFYAFVFVFYTIGK